MSSLHGEAAQHIPCTCAPDGLLILPSELLVEVLQQVGWRDVLNLRAVSWPHRSTIGVHPADRLFS